jgi:hypothetical protein
VKTPPTTSDWLRRTQHGIGEDLPADLRICAKKITETAQTAFFDLNTQKINRV